MQVLEKYVIGKIASLLNSAGLTVLLPGLPYQDSERGDAWVEISALTSSRPIRTSLGEVTISVNCFSSNLTSSYSALKLGDDVLEAIGTSFILEKDNSPDPPIKVGLATLRGVPEKRNLGQQKELLHVVVDFDIMFVES